MPLAPIEWSLPVLLWSGPELEAPTCPADQAGVVEYEGHTDPRDPSECPVCSCGPPSGECGLPSFLTVSSKDCGVNNSQTKVYDFSGLELEPLSCNTDNPVLFGLEIQSLTIGPLTMTESGCEPLATIPPKNGSAFWKTFARACSNRIAACSDPVELCVSVAEAPPGFSQCIYRPGEHECPSGYPTKRVFYDDVNDSRHCSECSCEAPKGGACTALVTAYQDASCSVLGTGYLVQLTEMCGDIIAGAGLGSKQATTPIYEPGVCQPIGGDPVGSAELLGPTTFCCQ